MARPVGVVGKNTELSIREQSLRLFAQLGYHAVSMRMIGEAVGVKSAALYNYFPSKQDLLVALMREHMQALLAAWDAEKVEDEEPALALNRFARFHVRYHIVRPDEVFISYMELRALEKEGFAEIEPLRRAYEKELQSILERGVAAGAFRTPEPHVTAMALLAMLTGVNTWYRTGGRLSTDRVEEIYAEMVLMSVGYADRGFARRNRRRVSSAVLQSKSKSTRVGPRNAGLGSTHGHPKNGNRKLSRVRPKS